MKKLIKATAFILLFSLFSMIGCNAGQLRDAPEETRATIMENMANQNNYSFKGKTTITFSEETLEDVVKFNGFINNKENLFLDLNISAVEGMPEEKMQIVKSPQKLMIKYMETETWQEVSEQEKGVFNEFRNWNPEFSLELINTISFKTADIEKEGGKKGLIIHLDPEEVKRNIEQTLRASLTDGTLTEEDIQEMKETLGLTDEEIAHMQQELENQVAETNRQIDEMIRTMSVESFYEIYYDPSKLLIQTMSQNTRTNFRIDGNDIEEVTIIDFEFSDYGKKIDLPAT